jgi:hypothetical protein
MTVLSSNPRTIREESVSRTILTNLGISLTAGLDVGKPLLRSGVLVRALACGYFSVDDTSAISEVVSAKGDALHTNAATAGKKWHLISDEGGKFDLNMAHLSGTPQNGVAYLSFWVQSPRSLEDILLQPNLPRVALEVRLQGAVTVWLNGQKVLPRRDSSAKPLTVDALRLRAGWNHFLLAVQSTAQKPALQAYFTSSDPEFLSELDSVLQRPERKMK